MRILFLARSMLRGGCERQLAVLATALQQRGHQVAVALFYGDGELTADLRQQNIPVIDLHKNGRWDLLGFCRRLVQAVADFAPDIIHGYLPVANCLALLAGRISGRRPKVVFGLRASDIRSGHYDRLSMLSYRLEERLAPWADLSIANSQAGRERAIMAGFPPERTIVIANGIDTERFQPNPDHRRQERTRLGLPDHSPLVGMVGRLDPMKDHPTFLAAAAAVALYDPDVRFLCVGDGSPEYSQFLRTKAAEHGLSDRLTWLPSRQEIEQLYPAFDVLVSASAFGEGFSNVLAEAMACGIPCVATDVGDSRRIIEQQNYVVPTGDSSALAAAIMERLRNKADPMALRQRILSDFSTGQLVRTTENALISLKAARRY